MIGEAIKKIVDGQHLQRAEMHDVFAEMMDGKTTDIQKSAFLVALRMKGETADEITGAAMAMRERVTRLNVEGAEVIDTCGTGGDARGQWWPSTATARCRHRAGAPTF
jgi:anthranilate phosphoribosyltransferase